MAAIILPQLPTLLGNFCKVVKIFHFSRKIIFGQLLKTFCDFLLVTLMTSHILDISLRNLFYVWVTIREQENEED